MIDLSEIRLEQARYLKGDAKQSALIVSGLVVYIAILLTLDGRLNLACLWALATFTMIGVTLLYAKFMASEGLNLINYKAYLRGHTAVTFCTGLVWGIFSILAVDYTSFFSMFVAFSIATSITVGGMFPAKSYRPAYIALAIPTVLILAFHFLLVAPDPTRYFGIGLFFFFGFAIFTSANAEIAARDQVITKNQQKLTDAIMAHSVEVKEAYDLKAKFLATASHDLSQPLHAQGHYIEALRRTMDRPEQEELVDKIAQTWRAQKEMLGNLVDAMRLDGGMIQPRFRQFDLIELIEELLNSISLEAKQRGVEVRSTLPETCPIQSDPIFLRRILSNVLSNVLKHAATGKQLDVNVAVNKSSIEICIEDGGLGFDLEGNVFASLDHVKKEGVGLSSIINLAKLIDAEPNLSNRPDGKGSVFTLHLPKKILGRGRANHLTKNSANSVLIIDDDKTILDAVTVLFTQWGIQTLSAVSVEEAVAMLNSTQMPLDLLIVDNRLSEAVDSVTAIKAVREQMKRDVPAVVVSGDVTAPAQLAGLKNVSLLPKPVEASDFRPFLNA